jgi:acyl-CoA thioester hydrolase
MEGLEMETHGAAPAAAGAPLHSTTVRLGYADTDPAGILYYAAWFPWMERMQSEWFWVNGLRQDHLSEKHGFWSVTCHTACDFLVPVGLFDEIRIELRLGRIGTKSFDMLHRMVRTADGVTVGRGVIRIVTVTPDGASVPIPDLLRAHLDAWREGRRLATDEEVA